MEVSDARQSRKRGPCCPMSAHGGPSHAIRWDFMGWSIAVRGPTNPLSSSGRRGPGRGGCLRHERRAYLLP
jgi:hypothetical protein